MGSARRTWLPLLLLSCWAPAAVTEAQDAKLLFTQARTAERNAMPQQAYSLFLEAAAKHPGTRLATKAKRRAQQLQDQSQGHWADHATFLRYSHQSRADLELIRSAARELPHMADARPKWALTLWVAGAFSQAGDAAQAEQYGLMAMNESSQNPFRASAAQLLARTWIEQGEMDRAREILERTGQQNHVLYAKTRSGQALKVASAVLFLALVGLLWLAWKSRPWSAALEAVRAFGISSALLLMGPPWIAWAYDPETAAPVLVHTIGAALILGPAFAIRAGGLEKPQSWTAALIVTVAQVAWAIVVQELPPVG